MAGTAQMRRWWRGGKSVIGGMVADAAGHGLETLESRQLLAIDAAVALFATTATTLQVSVLYTGSPDTSTLGDGAVVLHNAATGADTAAHVLVGPAVVGEGVAVVYQFFAPGGAWGWSDTATYVVRSPAGVVQSTTQESLSHVDVGQTYLWFNLPKVTLVDQQLRTSDWLVTVDFSGADGINPSTINGGAIYLDTPNGPFGSGPVVSRTTIDSHTVRALYAIQSPASLPGQAIGQGWTSVHNGTYRIAVAPDEVRDNSGNVAPQVPLAQFFLWFQNSPYTVQATDVVGSEFRFVVTFSAAGGVDPTTIGDGDFVVTDGNGDDHAATLRVGTALGNGVFQEEYSVIAPAGSWDFTDNGTYTVTLQTGAVQAVGGANLAAGVSGSYYLWFANPSAQMQFPTDPTQHQWDIAVVFDTESNIDQTTITSSSLTVTGPSGSQPVSLIDVSVNDAGQVVATFRVTSIPGLSNGHYSVAIAQNGVMDDNGVGVNANELGSFLALVLTKSEVGSRNAEVKRGVGTSGG